MTVTCPLHWTGFGYSTMTWICVWSKQSSIEPFQKTLQSMIPVKLRLISLLFKGTGQGLKTISSWHFIHKWGPQWTELMFNCSSN